MCVFEVIDQVFHHSIWSSLEYSLKERDILLDISKKQKLEYKKNVKLKSRAFQTHKASYKDYLSMNEES